MRKRSRKVTSLLAYIQDAARRRQTNAYQIAKATSLPLRSIQKLLSQTVNPTLKNVHLILEGFGVSLYVIEGGKPSIKPGSQARRRGEGVFSITRSDGSIIRNLR